MNVGLAAVVTRPWARDRQLPERRRRARPAAAVRSSRPARRAWRAGRRSRGTTTCRSSPTSCCAGAAVIAASRSRRATRPSRRSRPCSSPAARSSSGSPGTRWSPRFFCAALVAVSATDLERRIIPNRIVLPAAAVVLVANTRRAPLGRVGCCGASAPPPSSCSPRSPTRRDGHGRREARPAARRRRSGRTVPVGDDDRDDLGARARRSCCSPGTARRRGRWGSRSGRSSRSAVWSRCSPGTTLLHAYLGLL